MSFEIGMDVLNLRKTSRLGHTEYCDHEPLMRQVQEETGKSYPDGWDLDFIWNTCDGPKAWSELGRTTDMGHAEFMENGKDMRQPKTCPFTDVEQVLSFDATREYGLMDSDELTAFYETQYQATQRAFPNQVIPGGYYKTIVSGAIEAFGWDMLLLAASETDRFEKVLDSIFRLSLHHFKAWTKTSIDFFICHDDMVWSEGPFIRPDFYRRVIFPRYTELWKVLHDAGKKVLYCSDGNWTMFLDDIAQAGADGFIFEPMVSLDEVVGKYGQTHVILGSKVDCRTLTFGTFEQIRKEIDATLEIAMDCPGFMFAIGNHIPVNIPLENAIFYMDYLRQNWSR